MFENLDAQSAGELLDRARKQLEQESYHIQIQGRALSGKERRRIEKIGRAIDLIKQAMGELGGDEDTPSW